MVISYYVVNSTTFPRPSRLPQDSENHLNHRTKLNNPSLLYSAPRDNIIISSSPLPSREGLHSCKKPPFSSLFSISSKKTKVRSTRSRAMMRRALTLHPHFLHPKTPLLPISSSAAAGFGRRTFIAAVINNGDAVTGGKRRGAPSVPGMAASKSVSAGLVGAVSFSVALSTAVEAKEAPLLDLLPKEVVLYQYEACPFCNKVKAFLDYHDIPYKVVEVNPFGKKEIKWSDYKKVPILVVDGEQLVESSDIIDKLNRKIHPENAIVDEEESKWTRWVDEHLVHVLSPNIYRTIPEALESFEYITTHGNFKFHERLTAKYAGAAVMYMVSKKLKKKYNITDERAALYEAAETWSKAVDGREFLGGSRPNLADLSVFGVLRPIRYLKAGKEMVENTSIGEWYQRMESAVGESSRLQA